MKNNFSHIGLAKLCGWFGITRQAYYFDNWKEIDRGIEEEIILKEVIRIRKNHQRMGARKLYEMLTPLMIQHQVKMGRDKLFDLLSTHHLLIRRRRRNIRTTFSNHWLRKYPNLTRNFIPTAPNQLWVSDITHWKVNGYTVYITFITDAYSHRIVGYNLAETLEAVESILALQMALSRLGREIHLQLIHHSDRGVQYCSQDYVGLLNKHEIKISMTESGDPLENPVAERVNGIMKEEYLEPASVKSVKEAIVYLHKAIALYNTERPHMSISNYTPDTVHFAKQPLKIKRMWKNYYNKKSTVNQFQE
ncbi:MAG: transposase [Bacteroidetes bacterium CG_4_10_14_3_um_filter_31_20]|nr:MAG: transposase [Bacteroidetes bacterium CG_4_10_14_3_um_filter_31_20]